MVLLPTVNNLVPFLCFKLNGAKKLLLKTKLNIMNVEDKNFKSLVKEMRQAQIDYIKQNRAKNLLNRTKELENSVDNHLNGIIDIFQQTNYSQRRKSKRLFIVSFMQWFTEAKKNDPNILNLGYHQISEMYLFEHDH